MFICGTCEDFMQSVEPNTVDIILTDPPYNASEDDVIKGETELKGFKDHRAIEKDFGEWDKGYDPKRFLELSTRVLKPGGWLVICSGDRTFGAYHSLIHEIPSLYYKASLSWCKTNSPSRVRKVNFRSAVEWIVVAIRSDLENNKVPPVAFNWLGQRNMKNYFLGPICSIGERIYWHIVNEDVYPCRKPSRCPICKERGIDDRKRHPTQKPQHLWEWFLRRLSSPGMTVYDPYAGVGSSKFASERFGLEWIGTERDPEFHMAGELWHEGAWAKPIGETYIQRNGLLDDAILRPDL